MTFEHLLTNLGLMWAYSISTVAMLLFILKVIDKLTPRYNLEQELVYHKNIAVAIPSAALILGVSAIIIACIVS